MSAMGTLARRTPRAQGAALVVVLVLTAAGMALSSAVANTAALEFTMVDGGLARLRAMEAAEAGLAAALRARAWSAGAAWNANGTLAGGSRWTVQVQLVAARVDPPPAPVTWRFDIESAGRHGAARVVLMQSFDVEGALPGQPRRVGWRQVDDAP